MPEGDSVHRAAGELSAALTGRRLIRTDFRVPRYATLDLSGSTITGVVAVGKHLLFRLESGLTLHTHFMMEGRWDIYELGSRWRGPAHEVRIVLETLDVQAVGFRLAKVDVVASKEESRLVSHLGPDILGPHWRPPEAAQRVRRSPAGNLKEALLDQTAVAGIGNIYASEALWAARQSPFASARVADVECVLAEARGLMMASLEGSRRPFRVYGRAGLVCERCGAVIRRSALGPAGKRRATYWCPSCQAF